ncbi:MAG TPA: hypothetical protein VE083_05580 [Terriglobales bacterium]|nr:hypothetical protein [Terriglobales bacterium]
MLNFSGDKIRKVDVPDVGTIGSVTLALTIDAGSTTFRVLIPQVELRNQIGASAFICTDGITTVHRLSVVPSIWGSVSSTPCRILRARRLS